MLYVNGNFQLIVTGEGVTTQKTLFTDPELNKDVAECRGAFKAKTRTSKQVTEIDGNEQEKRIFKQISAMRATIVGPHVPQSVKVSALRWPKGLPKQHRTANVGPSKRSMISHIFFVKEICFFENDRSSLKSM